MALKIVGIVLLILIPVSLYYQRKVWFLPLCVFALSVPVVADVYVILGVLSYLIYYSEFQNLDKGSQQEREIREAILPIIQLTYVFSFVIIWGKVFEYVVR